MRKLSILICLIFFAHNLHAQIVLQKQQFNIYHAGFRNLVPDDGNMMKSSYALFSEPNTDYLKKSKNQHKTALILLGSGAALILASFIIPKGDPVETDLGSQIYAGQKYQNSTLKATLGVIGVASGLASIPFFIMSGKNKKKATASAAFIDMQTRPAVASGNSNRPLPVMGFRVSL